MASKSSNLKLKNIAPSDESSEDEKVTSGADIGISLDKLNLGPKKKLLVLSLGGVLVHRIHVRERSPRNIRPDIFLGNFRVFKRPFCDDFLKFCFQRFEVALWSSAMEHNIDALLSTLLGENRKKLLFVWDQKKCTDTGFTCLENSRKPIFLKELSKIWEKFSKYSSGNTLMIDDEPYKALLNPPNTAIFPKNYRVSNTGDDFLCPKGELQSFLDGLVNADDVPSYLKNNPFGQAAITASHSDWKFYSKIIDGVGKGGYGSDESSSSS